MVPYWLQLLTASGVAALAASMVPSYTPTYEAVAVTAAGGIYHVGNGRTCAEAFRTGKLPDDWRHLVCRAI